MLRIINKIRILIRNNIFLFFINSLLPNFKHCFPQFIIENMEEGIIIGGIFHLR